MVKQILIEAAIVFVGIFCFNYFVYVRKNKKLKKNDMPLELTYISAIYDIDPTKINFRRFQYTYCLINSFIITITYVLAVYLVKHMLLKVIIGIVTIIFLIIICYGLLGRYYQYKEDNSTEDEK